jgi:hypothetical protein
MFIVGMAESLKKIVTERISCYLVKRIRGPMANDFNRNIFVNCPFDDEYRQLLVGIAFTIVYFGYRPRLALERADSAESRIDKILGLINESKFGIHDLSRLIATEKDESCRMNMPFELGIDYGCQKLRGGRWARKKILILEKERYRFQKAISDLSGSDIKSHGDEVSKVIAAVRDWLVTEELKRGDSGARI